MDPDENLTEQLEIANRIDNYNGNPLDALEDAERLAELVLALNEYLYKGGYLPKTWQQ